jgi:20S proteasome alpha/beta subunit
VTLIVGIKCSDGIVVGADGAATFGAMGQHTIRQSVRKLTIISQKIIVGVSGPVGLGQRFNWRIEELYSNNHLSGKKCPDAMKVMREALWKDIEGEMKAAAVARETIGQLALSSALSSSLVALPLDKKFVLIQFDQQGAPEEATENLPFVSIGSGQPTADPFLAFIRKIFWPDSLPSLEAGIFSTLWTLNHAIETNPGGVSEPTQIMVLEKDGKDFTARELESAELEEHLEAITAAESVLKDFRKTSSGSTDTPPSLPPEPPALAK